MAIKQHPKRIFQQGRYRHETIVEVAGATISVVCDAADESDKIARLIDFSMDVSCDKELPTNGPGKVILKAPDDTDDPEDENDTEGTEDAETRW